MPALRSPLLAATAIACLPTIPEPSTPESQDSASTADTATHAPDDGDDSAPETPSSTSAFLIETGEWFYRSVEMVDDPCGWKPFLDQLPDGVADVLPTSYDVDARAGKFDIEAIRFGGNFGTSAPVTCVFDDRSFVCEAQPVVPVDLFLGSYGWTYDVVFTGEARDRRTLSGTAVVTFESVDEQTGAMISDQGFRLSDCTQVLEMVIGYGQHH